MNKTDQSRAQRRFQERVVAEAQTTLNNMLSRYTTAFTTHDDPEGEDMVAIFNRMNAQWIAYCKMRLLNIESHNAFNQFATKLLNDYREAKGSPIPHSI